MKITYDSEVDARYIRVLKGEHQCRVVHPHACGDNGQPNKGARTPAGITSSRSARAATSSSRRAAADAVNRRSRSTEADISSSLRRAVKAHLESDGSTLPGGTVAKHKTQQGNLVVPALRFGAWVPRRPRL